MKMGELYDRLEAIKKAEADLEYAESRLVHGGNAQTMEAKHAAVKSAEDWLNYLRLEPVHDDEQ